MTLEIENIWSIERNTFIVGSEKKKDGELKKRSLLSFTDFQELAEVVRNQQGENENQ